MAGARWRRGVVALVVAIAATAGAVIAAAGLAFPARDGAALAADRAGSRTGSRDGARPSAPPDSSSPTASTAPAALVTRGRVRLAPTAEASGEDTNPPGWTCADTGAAVAGLLVSDPSLYVNDGEAVRLAGTPRLGLSARAADSSFYFHRPGLDWDSLKARADVVITSTRSQWPLPVAKADGSCDRTRRWQGSSNWGEPRRAGFGELLAADVVSGCASWYPIIYVPRKYTPFRMIGGRGQGILLVDGDFLGSGRAEFSGVVIVRGSFVMAGERPSGVRGMVLVWNEAPASRAVVNEVGGNSKVGYSSCAIRAALEAAARGASGRRPGRRAGNDR